MGKQMNKRLKFGLIIVILVAVAIFAAFWAVVLRQQHIPGFQQSRLPPSRVIPGDFEYFYVAFTIISTINIALLVILTLIYVNIYIKTKSNFTIGLIIFALAFLVENLTSSPLVTSLYGFRAYGLGPFEFLPGLFEFFALTILLYLSIKY
jgi:hypothetical protein